MTVSTQFLHLAVLVISGLVVAAIIDCVRVIRLEAPHQSRIRQLTGPLELVMWFILGVGTYLLLFVLNKGDWRAIDPLAQILGILLYQTIFQRPIRFLGRVIRLLVLKPIWLLIMVIVGIIRWFINIVISIIHWIVNMILRIITWIFGPILRPIFKFCKKFVPTRFKKRM